jgi:O-antigen/teichoic acid export membrane protein
MLTTLFGTGSGFFFWIIAAKLYSSDEVGLAAAIISIMSLASMLSRLGFDIGIINYLPKVTKKIEIINSCIIIELISSVFFSVVILMLLSILAPKLIFLKENNIYMLLFILFTAFNTLLVMQNNIFAALLHSKYSFIQTLIAILRILLLPIVVIYGFFGMYFSYGLGILIASIVGNTLIRKIIANYRLKFEINFEQIREMFNFSFKNYVSSLFEGTPSYVLPLVIIHFLGAEENAYFYISWAISSFILMIPRATSISLFAEGSNQEKNIKKYTIKSIKFIYMMLLPTVVIVILFGEYILLFFGSEYSNNAYTLLKILALASIPFTLNIVFIAIKRIQHYVMAVIYMHLFLGVATIILSLLLINKFGLVGVGISWMIVNCIAGIFSAKSIFKIIQ